MTVTINETLYEACRSGDVKAAKAAIKKGADINAGGGYALHCACCDGHLEIVKLLVGLGADAEGRPAQAGACCNGRLDIVKFLIESGVDITVCDTCALRSARKCLESHENNGTRVLEYLNTITRKNKIKHIMEKETT